jgi:hypothetical protein
MTVFLQSKINVMRKYRALMAILLITAITATGCQVLSNGITKKSYSCEKIISTCTGTNETCDTEETDDVVHSTVSTDDILHNLPFSTIAE